MKVKSFYFIRWPPKASQEAVIYKVFATCLYPLCPPHLSLSSSSHCFSYSTLYTISWTFQACSHFRAFPTTLSPALMTLPQIFARAILSCPSGLSCNATYLITLCKPLTAYKLSSLPLCIIFLQSTYHHLLVYIYLFVYCLSPPTGLLHNKNMNFISSTWLFTSSKDVTFHKVIAQ